MLRLAKDGRGSLARDMTLRRPVEGDGGQLEHWLLLEQEGQGFGRPVLALPRWSPGGQQPFSSALLLCSCTTVAAASLPRNWLQGCGCSCRRRGHNLELELGLALRGGGSQGCLSASLFHLGENFK